MHITHTVFIRHSSYACLLLHLLIQYTAKLHMSLSIANTQFRARGSGGIREQRLHVILGVGFALGGVGLIRDLSNSLDIFRRELDLPSIRIPLVLQYFCRLEKYSRPVRSQYRTYRKFGCTASSESSGDFHGEFSGLFYDYSAMIDSHNGLR